MKWCRISTGTESVQVVTDEIVYIRADDNYSDFVLTNDKAKCRALTHFDQFYYISTRRKELFWDFVNDFRKYDFIDVIYITGGADCIFYRDRNGIRHDIENPDEYPQKKWMKIIPWLVFRKNKKENAIINHF